MNSRFDWEQFSRNLQEQMPDSTKESFQPEKLDLSWIETYVHNALQEAFNVVSPENIRHQFENSERPSAQHAHDDKQANGISSLRSDSDDVIERDVRELKTEVMEMLRYVVVKVHVPETLNPRRIKIAASPDRVKLRMMPFRKVQLIPLPHKVISASAKSVFNHDVIEIRLPKSKDIESFKEIRTAYME